MEIGETLRRALAKLVMSAAGDQAKTACGSLQLCAGLKAGIEGASHAVGQRQLDRVRGIISEEEDGTAEEEEGSENVEGLLNNLTKETAGTEEEAAEGLESALGMDVDGYEKGEVKGGEGGEGTQRAMGDLKFLTREA